MNSHKFAALAAFCFGFIQPTTSTSFADSFRTKLFLKDIAKCKEFNQKEYDQWMAIITGLSQQDIISLRNSRKQTPIITTSNPKVLEVFKEAKEAKRRPEGLKGSFLNGTRMEEFNKTYALMPHGIGAGNNRTGHVALFNIKDLLIPYQIPAEDYTAAVNAYSDYCLDILDKIQKLYEQSKKSGVHSAFRLKGSNGSFRGWDIYGALFYPKTKWPLNECYPTMYQTMQLQRGAILRAHHASWYGREADFRPAIVKQLSTNQNYIKTCKLWLEFIIEVDVASGTEHVEKMYEEVEWLEKRLAELPSAATASKISSPGKKPATNSKPDSPKKSGTLKLDLPDLD